MAETLDKCPICEGKLHEFEEGRFGCEKCKRVWYSDGTGGWNSEVRQISEEEFYDLFKSRTSSQIGKREIDVTNGWINYMEAPPRVEELEVLAYSPSWIHPDFNPKGTRVGFVNSDGGFTCARWNDEQDSYITDDTETPLFWKPIS